MNIGTHFDYNNHIIFISTHTKMGTPHARYYANGSEFADSALLNVTANFSQCLSLIVSKLMSQDIYTPPPESTTLAIIFKIICNVINVLHTLVHGSFHVKSTQKNPYPHRFERNLVFTVSVEILTHTEFQRSAMYGFRVRTR